MKSKVQNYSVTDRNTIKTNFRTFQVTNNIINLGKYITSETIRPLKQRLFAQRESLQRGHMQNPTAQEFNALKRN